MVEKLCVFATGTATGGGSGAEKLVQYSRMEIVEYDVSTIVSNIAEGGVRERALRLGVPFEHFPGPWTAERYRDIVRRSGAKWVALSGWLKFVVGLDPARTFNIHPALLSFQSGRFGGPGLYGHHVHEAVALALENGELGDDPHSGFTMHFVVDGDGDKKKGFDTGPIFCEVPVKIRRGMTADEIGHAVNKVEHVWQPIITNWVVAGKIRLEHGKVVVPPGYSLLPKT